MYASFPSFFLEYMEEIVNDTNDTCRISNTSDLSLV